MDSVTPEIFLSVLLFLLVPFLCAFILRRLHLPTVIGYLIGGVLLGNFFPFILSSHFVNQFAFFGILLLMFTIGLEINFDKLVALKRFIVIGGLVQTVLCLVSISLISLFFDFSLLQSLLIGIAFSSSSTALVAKIIQEKGEESSFLGELALGILMFQDIIFIPFIIILTFLKAGTDSYTAIAGKIGVSMVQSLLILLIMYVVGSKFVQPLFNRIAETSRELLNVFIIIFIFLVAFISSQFNVPIFIGMFIAGILVAHTSEHYHIFSQIRPFRDVLAIIFFVYIGTHIDLSLIMTSLPKLLLFSAVIMLIKGVIIVSLFLYFKFSSRLAFSLATMLFQVSETAFILMTLAVGNKLMSQDQYLFIISTVLISLISTPLIVNKKDSLYGGIRLLLKKHVPSIHNYIKYRVDFKSATINLLDMKNHVIICGYGRVGSYIGRALTLAHIPFIAIDYNFHIVDKAQKEGINIIYGDPTDIDILDFAQVEKGIVVISVVPEKYSQEAIVLNAKKLNPQIMTISRLHSDKYVSRLKDLGVSTVVLPEFEASISIIKKILLLKKVPKAEIVHKIHHLKVEHGMA